MKQILVTGANGQLGLSLQALQDKYPNLKFVFTNKTNFDISNASQVDRFFNKNSFDWCINCAAYTNVDKAETEAELARSINTTAVMKLAEASEKHNIKLIHVSTDFIFDGSSSEAYVEKDVANPLGVYGRTKLDGEQALIKHCKSFFIIRTSWLYSEFSHNFLKTMLRLEKTKDEINVVSDQIGTPTYAKDLAHVILKIISEDQKAYGVYHYSNEGVASWYDFAKAIFDITNSKININPISTNDFPTLAKRPGFSVLNKEKIKKELNVSIPYWRDSLEKSIKSL